MRTHELKTWPEMFCAIERGEKTAEARRDDRGFMVGDMLVLVEFDPSKPGAFQETGRRIDVMVTHKLAGGNFGIERGFCVLSFDPDQRHGPYKFSRS